MSLNLDTSDCLFEKECFLSPLTEGEEWMLGFVARRAAWGPSVSWGACGPRITMGGLFPAP